MKQLIITIAIIVAMITVFVFVDGKVFNHYDVFQRVQGDIPATNWKPTVSVPTTKLITEVKTAVETKPIAEVKPENNSAMLVDTPAATLVADAQTEKKPTAVPVATAEEAIRANEDALKLLIEKEKYTQPKDIKAVAEIIIEDKPVPMAVPVLTPEEAEGASKAAVRFHRNKAIARSFKALIHKIWLNNNRIHYILSLLPLLFIIDVFLFKKKKQKDNKVIEYISLPRRIRILFSVSLLAFGILVFVPWSVYFGNSLEFPFIFQDFVRWNLRVLTISIVGACIILLLIPPIISDYIIAIIAGLGFCVYMQAMFMNQHLGTMDGTGQAWSEHRIFGSINLIVWVVIVSVPIIIRKKTPSLFSKIVSTTSGSVLFLEMLATVSMVLSADQKVWSRKDSYYVDYSKQFQLSKEKNVVVFIMDALGSGFVQKCFETYPEAKEIVKDFIWYTDARSNYFMSFPGILHELTGAFLAIPAKNYDEIFDKTWHSISAKSFYKQIKDAGYDAKFYISVSSDIIGEPDFYHEYFSNIDAKDITYSIDYKRIHSCLKKMSGFSSAPYFLKRLFFYEFDFSDGIVEKHISDIPQGNNDAVAYNPVFLRKLSLSGITTDADKAILSFFYTRGSHPPWYCDEKCNNVQEPLDNPIPTTRGCFYLLSEFIRFLKEANIYDNTAILLCSDHGGRVSQYQTPYDMTFMIKPFHVRKAEVSTDDSPVQSVDILPTLLKTICGDDADFKDFEGYPSFDIPNGRIRKVYSQTAEKDITNWGVQKYSCYNEFNFVSVETFSDSIKSENFIRQIPLIEGKTK